MSQKSDNILFQHPDIKINIDTIYSKKFKKKDSFISFFSATCICAINQGYKWGNLIIIKLSLVGKKMHFSHQIGN